MHDGADQEHRKKMRRWETASAARYITFSCYRRMGLMKSPELRDVFVEAVGMAREKHRFRLIAWVVMPEHVHLIIVPRPVVAVEGGVTFVASRSTGGKALFTLKSSVAQRVIGRWVELDAPVLGKIRQRDGSHRFWQAGGGFDRNVRDEDELLREIDYIHLNPVRRGLVTKPCDWAWSSARWYAGEASELPIDDGWGGRRWEPPEEWVRDAVPMGDRPG